MGLVCRFLHAFALDSWERPWEVEVVEEGEETGFRDPRVEVVVGRGWKSLGLVPTLC